MMPDCRGVGESRIYSKHAKKSPSAGFVPHSVGKIEANFIRGQVDSAAYRYHYWIHNQYPEDLRSR